MLLLLALLAQAPTERPAGETRKHLQVLQSVPESQLFLTMNAMAQSLGVGCEYCHVRDGAKYLWERDDKPKKAVGRRMMKMVMDLNAGAFDGKQTVTCFTCHRGSIAVRSLIPLPAGDLMGLPSPAPPLPDASTILARYLDAVNAHAAASLGTIVLRGTEERSQGRSAAYEVTIKGPDKILVTRTSAEQGTIAQSVDGTKGWTRTPAATGELTPQQIEQFRNAASMFNPVKVAAPPADLRVAGTERIDDRTAYVLVSGTGPVPGRQLFFDTESGLLIRTITTTTTPIVPLLDQVDYSDYRVVAGVRLPFTIRTSNVGYYDTSVRKFTEVRTGVAVDDGVFNLSAWPK
jgi:photosynthetic reaction center cytochrome c subunit